jgi:hypothetical protein
MLVDLRSAPNKSNGYSAYELVGISNPLLNMNGAMGEQQEEPEMSGEKWQHWLMNWNELKNNAILNDIKAKDKRVVTQNSKRMPMAFKKGDWVTELTPAGKSKTQRRTTEEKKIISVSEDKTRYVLQDQSGRKRTVAIDRLLKTIQPAGAEVNGKFGQDAGVAMEKDEFGYEHYFIIAVNNEDAEQGTVSGKKLFKNARPKSGGTQAKWYLSRQNTGELKLIRKFKFIIHHKTGYPIIPQCVRREFRELPYIFGN